MGGQIIPFPAPYADKNTSWFYLDDDQDGLLNGPSDWDSDGDGMPDGYEYCYSVLPDVSVISGMGLGLKQGDVLSPSDPSDGFYDWDDDGLNNVEEYSSALIFGGENFTSPWLEDTDEDGMPDGWETNNGLNPRDGDNGKDDPDKDGFDRDGDGAVVYDELVFNTLVTNIYVQVDDKVDVNQVVAQGQITKAGGQIEYVNLKSNSAGTVYNIFVNENDVITSRSTV